MIVEVVRATCGVYIVLLPIAARLANKLGPITYTSWNAYSERNLRELFSCTVCYAAIMQTLQPFFSFAIKTNIVYVWVGAVTA